MVWSKLKGEGLPTSNQWPGVHMYMQTLQNLIEVRLRQRFILNLQVKPYLEQFNQNRTA